MRKIVILLGVAMVMLVVAAGVAVAVERQCNDNEIPCRGTENNDDLVERQGQKRDRILGLAGDDLLSANDWGNDRDRLLGGPDGDRLLSNDGDVRDGLDGGRGSDRCVIDQGDNAQSCSVNIEAAFKDPAGSTD